MCECVCSEGEWGRVHAHAWCMPATDDYDDVDDDDVVVVVDDNDDDDDDDDDGDDDDGDDVNGDGDDDDDDDDDGDGDGDDDIITWKAVIVDGILWRNRIFRKGKVRVQFYGLNEPEAHRCRRWAPAGIYLATLDSGLESRAFCYSIIPGKFLNYSILCKLNYSQIFLIIHLNSWTSYVVVEVHHLIFAWSGSTPLLEPFSLLYTLEIIVFL